MALILMIYITGCLGLLIGLFGGGLKAKELEVQKIPVSVRIFSSVFGVILIGVAVMQATHQTEVLSQVGTPMIPITGNTPVSTNNNLSSDTQVLFEFQEPSMTESPTLITNNELSLRIDATETATNTFIPIIPTDTAKPTKKPQPTKTSPPTDTIQPTTPAPPQSPAGYSEQSSYSGDCSSRPPNTVCVKYSDGFIWLVDDSIQSWKNGGTWEGHLIKIAEGFKYDYYHILDTNYVKKVKK